MLFDADCSGGCSGQDPDLMLPGAGNVLIISEDNDHMDPDDSGFGGTINVSFATDVTDITGITVDVGDSDNGPNTIEVLLDGMVVDTLYTYAKSWR